MLQIQCTLGTMPPSISVLLPLEQMQLAAKSIAAQCGICQTLCTCPLYPGRGEEHCTFEPMQEHVG